MVLHTLAAFAGVARLRGTLVAVAPGTIFAGMPTLVFSVECGGPTRADTVLGGLRALLARGAQAHDWVLVHDAARCLVTSAQIDALIDACARWCRRAAGAQTGRHAQDGDLGAGGTAWHPP